MLLRIVPALCLAALALAQTPNRPPTYLTNKSTLIMPCNGTGITSPASTLGWHTIDFDWSNNKGIGSSPGWAKHQPMDADEQLLKQVEITTNATANSSVWVYRCSVYAYPWFTSVRTILEDPAYSPWFINFRPEPFVPFSPRCDTNFDPPKCSSYFHMQEQTPGYPHGDGDCAPPGCDCGTVPCGFYL
jgi:hypothetical protein